MRWTARSERAPRPTQRSRRGWARHAESGSAGDEELSLAVWSGRSTVETGQDRSARLHDRTHRHPSSAVTQVRSGQGRAGQGVVPLWWTWTVSGQDQPKRCRVGSRWVRWVRSGWVWVWVWVWVGAQVSPGALEKKIDPSDPRSSTYKYPPLPEPPSSCELPLRRCPCIREDLLKLRRFSPFVTKVHPIVLSASLTTSLESFDAVALAICRLSCPLPKRPNLLRPSATCASTR
ncbi:hypothetical protein BC567DRAFT_71623 [Phyllosticta citribraziliensis]